MEFPTHTCSTLPRFSSLSLSLSLITVPILQKQFIYLLSWEQTCSSFWATFTQIKDDTWLVILSRLSHIHDHSLAFLVCRSVVAPTGLAFTTYRPFLFHSLCPTSPCFEPSLINEEYTCRLFSSCGAEFLDCTERDLLVSRYTLRPELRVKTQRKPIWMFMVRLVRSRRERKSEIVGSESR